MHECSPIHLRIGATKLKDKETGEEGKKMKTNMEKGTVGTKKDVVPKAKLSKVTSRVQSPARQSVDSVNDKC